MSFLEFLSSVFASVAWPITVGFCMWLLEDDVRGLMKSLKIMKLKTKYVEAEFDQISQKQKADASLTAELSSIENLPLVDPLAREIEKNHQETLEKFPDERKQNVLIRALTNTQLEKFFALAYAVIFGSQIRALDILNNRKVQKAEAREMFEGLAKQDPLLENWDLERYMSFLIAWRFVEDDGDNYAITETGRNFLRYLTNAGLSKERLH